MGRYSLHPFSPPPPPLYTPLFLSKYQKKEKIFVDTNIPFNCALFITGKIVPQKLRSQTMHLYSHRYHHRRHHFTGNLTKKACYPWQITSRKVPFYKDYNVEMKLLVLGHTLLAGRESEKQISVLFQTKIEVECADIFLLFRLERKKRRKKLYKTKQKWSTEIIFHIYSMN